MLAELVRRIANEAKTGKLFEYYVEKKLMGVGAILKEDSKNARFVVDVTKAGLDKAAIIITKTVKAASRWKTSQAYSIIPKTSLSIFMDVAKWKTETARDIPVTRLI